MSGVRLSCNGTEYLKYHLANTCLLVFCFFFFMCPRTNRVKRKRINKKQNKTKDQRVKHDIEQTMVLCVDVCSTRVNNTLACTRTMSVLVPTMRKISRGACTFARKIRYGMMISHEHNILCGVPI